VKHAVQRGILGTNSAFAPGSRKTMENFDRVGRLRFSVVFLDPGANVELVPRIPRCTLTCPAYNFSARTAQKTLVLCCCLQAVV
jgi:hypothetical protein